MGAARQNMFHAILAHLSETAVSKNHTVLMVGELPLMKAMQQQFSHCTGVVVMQFADLTVEILNSLGPDSVVSPAICQDFDCIELADLLARANYSGAFRVLCGAGLHPETVKRDLRSCHPFKDFDVLSPVQTRPRLETVH